MHGATMRCASAVEANVCDIVGGRSVGISVEAVHVHVRVSRGWRGREQPWDKREVLPPDVIVGPRQQPAAPVRVQVAVGQDATGIDAVRVKQVSP